MIEVTKKEFYDIIFNKKLNVHPVPYKDRIEWVYCPNMRELFGIETPGYKEEGVKSYKVRDMYAKKS